MKPVDAYFFKQQEPYQSIMLYIRSVILKTLPNVEERYSYNIPFYYYNKKPFCYLNILKGTRFVDVAFLKGIILKDEFPQLKDYNNRKHVRSLQFVSIENIDEPLLVKVIKSAAALSDK